MTCSAVLLKEFVRDHGRDRPIFVFPPECPCNLLAGHFALLGGTELSSGTVDLTGHVVLILPFFAFVSLLQKPPSPQQSSRGGDTNDQVYVLLLEADTPDSSQVETKTRAAGYSFAHTKAESQIDRRVPNAVNDG